MRRALAVLAATTALTAASAAFAQVQAPQGQTSPQPPEQVSAPNAATTPPGGGELSQPTTSAARGPVVLEEIVVTADRRNSYSSDLVQAGSFRGARQLDTPLTVSVVPQEVIQSQQARTLLEALQNTAGVTSSQTSPTVYNNLSIRGIPVENRGNYRLNGSLPIVNLIDLPLEDKDRVEALKGASALYYGFTTPSGIINMTMKRPTREPFFEADAFGDNHGGFGGHIDASGTANMVGARINLVDAYVDSGIKYATGQRTLAAGAFDIKPTDNLTFNFDGEHIFKAVVEPGIFLLSAPKSTVANPYPSITLPPLLPASTNFGPSWARNHAEETNLLGRMNWKFNPAWDLTVEAGTSILHRDRRFSTLTPTNLATGDGTLSISLQPDAHYRNENVRAEIAGAFATGPFIHELLIGASENIRDQWASNSVKALCPSATGTTQVTCTQNFFNPRPIPETPLPAARVGDHTRIDDIGYYAFDRIKYGEWLQVLAGVRKSDYTESNRSQGTTTFHAEPTSISYGAVIKPRSWASIYATYIEGLESTPTTPQTAANAGQQLPPSESTQKEAGIKLEPRRGLLFQAAYFTIDRASTYINAQNVFVQNGRARYQGVETSLTGEITRDWSVYASALFLDAKQISGAPTIISGTTVTPTAVGKRIENTPRQTYSLATEYRLGQFVHGLSVTGAIYFVGDRAVNVLNQAFVPSYTLVDLGVAYTHDIVGHPTTFRINAENVGDKRYWASTGGLYLSEGAPSTVKFQVSTRF